MPKKLIRVQAEKSLQRSLRHSATKEQAGSETLRSPGLVAKCYLYIGQTEQELAFTLTGTE